MKKVLYLGIAFSLLAACLAGTTLRSRQKYVASHAEMSREIQNAILAGEICMGMTEDQVVAAMGMPNHVNRSTYEFGTRVQFAYDAIGSNFNFNKYSYVYFENGKVTSWSQ
jgi:outer membrane protein assembly factor BamE (lipoprotein component of BamABCDE complex)